MAGGAAPEGSQSAVPVAPLDPVVPDVEAEDPLEDEPAPPEEDDEELAVGGRVPVELEVVPPDVPEKVAGPPVFAELLALAVGPAAPLELATLAAVALAAEPLKPPPAALAPVDEELEAAVVVEPAAADAVVPLADVDRELVDADAVGTVRAPGLSKQADNVTADPRRRIARIIGDSSFAAGAMADH